MPKRTCALMTLPLLMLAAGCTLHVKPDVSGPYKRYPRTTRMDRHCVIVVDAREQQSVYPMMGEYVVPVRSAVERAARNGLRQLFRSTSVASGDRAPAASAGDVLVHLTVQELDYRPAPTAFHNEEATIVIRAAIQSGGGRTITQTVTGRRSQLRQDHSAMNMRFLNQLFGAAIVDAMDELNAFIHERRHQLTGGR